MYTEDLGVNGVELLRDAVEQLGPFGLELTIHPALRFGPVGNPGNSCPAASNPNRWHASVAPAIPVR